MSVGVDMADLQVFVRPPRLLLVTPGGERWAGWAARGLVALSHVWGGCASAVLPADVVDDAALAPFLRAFQPDHVLALNPTMFDLDCVAPGSIDEMLRHGGIEPTRTVVVSTRLRGYRDEDVAGAESAAERLRARLGVLSTGDESFTPEQNVQFRGLDPDGRPHDLTARSAVTETAAWGVPAVALGDLRALAAAVVLGAQETGRPPEVTVRTWEAALLGRPGPYGGQAALFRALFPDGTPGGEGPAPEPAASLLDPLASDCLRLTRGRSRTSWVVVGDGAADFALAGLARQVLGDAVWLPAVMSDDASVRRLTASGSDPRDGGLVVTSASVPASDVEARLRAAGAPGPGPDEDVLRPVPVRRLVETVAGLPLREAGLYTAAPQDLDLPAAAFVVHRSGVDRRVPLGVRTAPDGSVEGVLPLPLSLPDGLDAERHRWLVTVLDATRPVPGHPVLSSADLLRTGANLSETFVKPSDGGVTHWSHRWDFVPAGALLSGVLAGPVPAWPSLRRVLDAAVRPGRVGLSAAGRRSVVAEGLLGSREAVEELAEGHAWSLARAFLDPTALPPTGSGPPHLKTPKVLSWEGVLALPANNWDPQDRARLRDDWTRRGVLRRGNVLNCGHCGWTEFYPLAEVLPVFRCRRCEAENDLTGPRWDNTATPVHEPRWYYALHPAVEDLARSDGDVPLLTTLALRKIMMRTPLVYPEFEVFPDGSAPLVEFDFALGTAQGLWVGEAKSNSKFGKGGKDTDRELGKLMDGAALLRATTLVLSTSQPSWPAATVERVRANVSGRTGAGQQVPLVLLLTDAREAPALQTLQGRVVRRL